MKNKKIFRPEEIYFNSFLAKIIIFIIKIYQKTLSPDHGIFKHTRLFQCCKYEPTCSQYTIDAVRKKGVIKGIILASYRILRCNPFSKGGWDPIK